MAFTPSKMVSTAKAEDGYLEKKSNAYLDDKTKNAGNKNYTKYARDVDTKAKGLLNGKKQGTSYCAVGYIWATCVNCGWDLKKVRKVLCFDGSKDDGAGAAGAELFANYFKAKKRYDKKPEVGCPVFFNHDGGTKPQHVGMVISITDKQIKTQEWNTKKNGKGGVFQKTYAKTNKKIVGYGHPKFDKESTEKPKEEKKEDNVPTKVVKASQPANKSSQSLNKSFKVKKETSIRDGASANAKALTTVPKGASVRCFGFYSVVNTVEWIYVQYIKDSICYQGFICGKEVT
ncbi:MAG: hypothetical protein J6Y02_23670 [Pseudobutyrivibrio sp.]|nr:hypothetical protein [Pseudobutyrivibrio sp.]